MKKFKHYFFTNFGIGIFDEVWLLYRLEILKNTVFLSLNNQTNKDFEWVVFVHKDMPRIFFENLYEYVGKSEVDIRIVPVNDYGLVVSEINDIISACDAEIIISSRIDDDDLLHKSAVDLIQEQVKHLDNHDRVIVSFQNGVEYYPSDNVLRPVEYESLALGLSMIAAKKEGVTSTDHVNMFAHHLIHKTLERQGKSFFSAKIARDFPLFYYTKHPLSDSYFFGARSRALRDEKSFNAKEYSCGDEFGITLERLDYLTTLTRQMPSGMPHKYLEKLGNIRNRLKSLPDNEERLTQELLMARSYYERRATRQTRSSETRGKLRVAIIGSCVSRDLFELESSVLANMEICFYSARSSVISYMAAPNQDPKVEITPSRFEEKRAFLDLNKEHWNELKKSRPDMIIVDFIDERIGLIQHSGGIFTASGPVINAFEQSNISFDIMRPWSGVARNLRKWALEPFMDKVYSVCPNILVHRAQWATSYVDAKGNSCDFNSTDFKTLINLNNSVLDEMFEWLEQSCLVPFDFIGGGESMMSISEHKWGFSPIHYHPSYVKSVAGQLAARVL